MRYVCIILCILNFVFPVAITAEPLWQWEHPQPQGGTLNDIDIYGTATAMAVGVNATVIQTTDAGASWSVATYLAGEEAQLNGICLINATHAIAVGDSGIILSTADGGATWAVQVSGTTNNLLGVDFEDELHGMAVGDSGTVLQTDDGGITWSLQTSGTLKTLYGAACISADTGFVVGDDATILKTVDSGVSWVRDSSYSSPSAYTFFDIYFLDSEKGWIAGRNNKSPVVLGTLDGGATWIRQPTPSFEGPGSTVSASIEAVHFADPNHGIAVGYRRHFYEEWIRWGFFGQTSDGGASWQWEMTYRGALTGTALFDANNGIAAGEGGVIELTSNGGITWVPMDGTLHSEVDMKSVAFFDSQKGFAVANDVERYFYRDSYESYFYFTDNGGATWDMIHRHSWAGFYDVAFADADTMYAVGHTPPVPTHPVIYKFTNNGSTMDYVDILNCTSDCTGLHAIDFGGSNIGIAVGGQIVKIQNGIATAVTDRLMGEFLYGVSMPTITTAYAVGTSGMIMKSSDAGDNWTQQISGTAETLLDVFFSDHLTGTAVGMNGIILRTTNGGNDWTMQESGVYADLTSVSFAGDLIGVVAAGNTLLKTKDGGASWVSEANLLTSVVDVVLIDPLNLVAVGGFTDIVARRGVPVPVFFCDFTAQLSPHGVELEWAVIGAEPVIGYRLYRSENGAPPASITEELLPVDATSYTDRDVRSSAEYEYTLVSVQSDGTESYSSPVSIKLPAASAALHQNYPNPFRPETTIRFVMPERAHVSLRVYDVAGHLVSTLVDGVRRAGGQEVVWDGRDMNGAAVSSGIYFYQLSTGHQFLTRKMILLK